jgi:hypothetical protein
MFPAVAPPNRPNVLIVSADRKSGKSHLLKWSMETWAIGGALVRYVELDTGVSKDFLAVLRQIRDGDTNDTADREYLHQALPAAAFRRFNWELNHRLRTGEPGEWKESAHPDGLPIADEGAPFDAKGEKLLEAPICARFHEALKAVAAQRPLILVFDKFTGLEGGALVNRTSFEKLVLHLFKPIADDRASQIRLVFSVTPTERTTFQLPLLTGAGVHNCTLETNYSDDALVSLALEMCWYQGEDVITALAKALLKAQQGNQSLQGLARLAWIHGAVKDSPLVAPIARMR